MKIIKMYVARRYGNEHYYCLFDTIPKIIYELVGMDYIGSTKDELGNIIFSNFLRWERYGGAFAGRTLSLTMKDGSTTKIKNHWFDCGSYKEHGEFISIGAGTLEKLQDCYVYQSMNINKKSFEIMLDDYYSREKEYEYREIEKWCKLQYTWYPVVIDGTEYPFMVNSKGDFVHRESKNPIYTRYNRINHRFKSSGKANKDFELCLFKLEYKDNGRLVKIERRMLDVLKESLPYSEEEIKHNCKIK